MAAAGTDASDATEAARLRPSRRWLIRAAVTLATSYFVFTVVVALGWLDRADLVVHNWVLANVDNDLLFVPWSTITAVGAGLLATTAVCLAAFLAWRAGSRRTAVVILAFSLAGGVVVDTFKSLHARPYPGGDAFSFEIAENRTACPEQTRCRLLLEGNATVYCPPGSRCQFYVLNETADWEEFNATASKRDPDVFPTRAGRAYPSGHTMGATLSWGAALLLGTRAVQRARGFDRAAVAGWAAVAFLGGISRMPVHAHWWTDVVGSWLLGGALLCCAILADDAWKARAGRQRERPGEP